MDLSKYNKFVLAYRQPRLNFHIEPYPLSAETFEPFARFNENYYTNV